LLAGQLLRPVIARPERSGDQILHGGLLKGIGSKMVSSKSRRGSKLPTPKLAVPQNDVASPKDLVVRFLELQRLRKQVHELEQLAATERCAIGARTGRHGGSNDREK
jgi:hypothetical protein